MEKLLENMLLKVLFQNSIIYVVGMRVALHQNLLLRLIRKIMKIKLITSIFLVLLLLGCNNDDEINPKILTQSQWLNVIENTTANQPYDYVSSIRFEPDGKVYSEVFLRELETKEVIGFREYFNGNFQIINGKIEVSIQELYTIQGSDEFYLDKEELSIVDGTGFSREYQLRNSNSELHTIMPIYASSLGIIYNRVD